MFDGEREANARAAEAETRATYVEGLLASILRGHAEFNGPANAEHIRDMLRRPGTADLTEALQTAAAVIAGPAASAAPEVATQAEEDNASVAPKQSLVPSNVATPAAPNMTEPHVPKPLESKEESAAESEPDELMPQTYVPLQLPAVLHHTDLEERRLHKEAKASYMRYYRSIRAPSASMYLHISGGIAISCIYC